MLRCVMISLLWICNNLVNPPLGVLISNFAFFTRRFPIETESLLCALAKYNFAKQIKLKRTHSSEEIRIARQKLFERYMRMTLNLRRYILLDVFHLRR